MTLKLLPLLCFGPLAACNTTGGQLITLPFSVGGAARDAGGPMRFTTPQGWQVELDQAILAVGPFYFNVDPPQTATLQSGVVIVEVTDQAVVDALDPALYPVDGGADGETGKAVSVEIDLFPPDQSQPLADQYLLNQSTAYLAGVAQRPLDGGTQLVPFEGLVTIDQSLANASDPLPSLQRVNGAQCDLTFTSQPATLVARIDPTHWFDSVDFSELIPPPPACADAGDGGCNPAPGWSPDAGPLTWSTRSSFNSEVLTGLQAQTGVYGFSLVPLQGGGG